MTLSIVWGFIFFLYLTLSRDLTFLEDHWLNFLLMLKLIGAPGIPVDKPLEWFVSPWLLHMLLVLFTCYRVYALSSKREREREKKIEKASH